MQWRYALLSFYVSARDMSRRAYHMLSCYGCAMRREMAVMLRASALLILAALQRSVAARLHTEGAMFTRRDITYAMARYVIRNVICCLHAVSTRCCCCYGAARRYAIRCCYVIMMASVVTLLKEGREWRSSSIYKSIHAGAALVYEEKHIYKKKGSAIQNMRSI